MNWGVKNIHKMFAVASLGFALTVAALPGRLAAETNHPSVKREAAASQFARAEELRELLNSKSPDQRSLSEYKKVVAGYQRVYMITPHATEVPDAVFAVAELNTEMGDHFGRSYYQTAADTYAYLIHDYPSSKHLQDAMLRLASLEKDQLGDLAASTKTYQDFQKKFPHSSHKREVQEALPAAREARLVKFTVVKEVAATFSPAPGCDRLRPGARSPIANLYLAGDWTATGWPATMEGAVRSGYLAAEAVLGGDGKAQTLLRDDLPAEGLSRRWPGKQSVVR